MIKYSFLVHHKVICGSSGSITVENSNTRFVMCSKNVKLIKSCQSNGLSLLHRLIIFKRNTMITIGDIPFFYRWVKRDLNNYVNKSKKGDSIEIYCIFGVLLFTASKKLVVCYFIKQLESQHYYIQSMFTIQRCYNRKT